MEETVEISKSDLYQLKKDSVKLAALEAGGVDNWDWYSDSLRDHDYVANANKAHQEIYGCPDPDLEEEE